MIDFMLGWGFWVLLGVMVVVCLACIGLMLPGVLGAAMDGYFSGTSRRKPSRHE